MLNHSIKKKALIMQEIKFEFSSLDHGCEFWKSPLDSINGAARLSLFGKKICGAVVVSERRSRNIIGKRYWKNKNDSEQGAWSGADRMQINNWRCALRRSVKGTLSGYLLTERERERGREREGSAF